jgi:hypothetical protein
MAIDSAETVAAMPASTAPAPRATADGRTTGNMEPDIPKLQPTIELEGNCAIRRITHQLFLAPRSPACLPFADPHPVQRTAYLTQAFHWHQSRLARP